MHTHTLSKIFYVTLKDLKTYYLKPPLISWGIIMPLALVFAFYLKNPQGIREIVPGLIGMVLLFGATSMEGVVITFEKRVGTLERLFLAPIGKASLLLGKMLSGVIFGFLMGLLFFIVSVFFFHLSPHKIFMSLVLMLLSAASFAALGMFVANSVKEVFEAMTMFNFFRFPMIFICGVFIPLESMPGFLKYLAWLLPLTYSVDGLRNTLFDHSSGFPLGLDLIMLVLFTSLFFVLSLFIQRRRLRRE